MLETASWSLKLRKKPGNYITLLFCAGADEYVVLSHFCCLTLHSVIAGAPRFQTLSQQSSNGAIIQCEALLSVNASKFVTVCESPWNYHIQLQFNFSHFLVID